MGGKPAIAQKGAAAAGNKNLPFSTTICGSVFHKFSISVKGAPNEFSASKP
jgi:hypothetical protein